jgi:[ribosomal protein S18]-alanine N-acetyltransferase
MSTLERTLAPGGAPTLRIRAVRADDLPRVLEIERASFSMPWREGTFHALLKRTDTDLLAAELDGELVGYAACWTVLDQAELGNLAVDAGFRGRGVGEALVRAVMERVARRGAAECFLEVRASNELARRLYERFGFAVVGRRARYYAHPTEDALVMRVRLRGGS